VLRDILNQSLHDWSSLFQTIEPRLESSLTGTGCNDGDIGRATVTEIANRDAATACEALGISQIVNMTLCTAPVTINQNNLCRRARHQ